MGIDVPLHEMCPFCEYVAGSRRCAFVARGETASAFVNPTQYECGALLVIPNSHVTTILEATPTDVVAVARLAQTVARALDLAFHLTGLNVFQNNGLASGQQVSHYHVHVVPRYGPWEPMKFFGGQDFPFQPVEELESVAVEIRRALAIIESG